MTETATEEAPTVEVMPPRQRKAKTETAVAIQQASVPAVTTPMNLLQIAVEKGADLDHLEKLMALQERWEANEARKAYVRAMAEFKADDVPAIVKNKRAGFESKGSKVDYAYASLDQVCAAIGPALAKHGLSHSWEIIQQGASIKVNCVLTHEQGHSERVPLEATADTSGSKNSIQAMASTVSYLERYTLLAATGLAATDQDDDGHGAAPRASAPKDERQATADTPPRPKREDFVGPEPIQVPQKQTDTGLADDWPGWGTPMIAALAKAETVEALEALLKANHPASVECEERAPKVFKSVQGAVNKKRAALESRTYAVIDLDGVAIDHAEVEKAFSAFEALITMAEGRGKDALEGLWESNSLSGQLRDAGFPEMADKLQDAHTQAVARAQAKATAAAPETAKPEDAPKAASPAPADVAPAQPDPKPIPAIQQKEPAAKVTTPAAPPETAKAPEPISPFSKDKRKADWPTFTRWMIGQVKVITGDEIDPFLEKHAREIRYCRDYRTKDAEEFDAALAERS